MIIRVYSFTDLSPETIPKALVEKIVFVDRM